jgi:proline dehydrogenase
MIDPFRDALLWASTNRVLAERLPRMTFVRATVRRFMPGEQATDALDAAEDLRGHGVAAAFTMLGEGVGDVHQADAVVDHYLGLLDDIAARELDAEISVKPTHLGYDLDPRVAAANVARLAGRAAERGTRVWLDMESSAYVDGTIALYRELVATFPDSGICLQAYLHRTAKDLERLLPLDPAIRLVKGAYDEKVTIAYSGRRSIDASFIALALRFLLEGRGRPIRLSLGTHDVTLIEQIAEQASAAGIGIDGFEVEMLYGIREDQQRRLTKAGYRVQSLIAYGEHWYPWYMRRLAERPANVLFALRQIVG